MRFPGLHHDGSSMYVPDQAPELGSTIDVWVRTSTDPRIDPGVTNIWIRTTFDAEPRFAPAEPVLRPGFGVTDGIWWCVPLLQRSPVNRYRFLLDGPGGYRWLTAEGLFHHDVTDDTDFRTVCGPPGPDWARDPVYLIFPDRFARSERAEERPLPGWAVPRAWDDPVSGQGPDRAREVFGGDLDGIANKLDHISALGAGTICLTPIFTAPANHRYCASTFDEIDPLLGGGPALQRLTTAAHARGLHIIGDLTTNHTGDQHPWFADAMAGGNDVYYIDPELPIGYETWVQVRRMPKLNWGSVELRRRMLSDPDAVARRWLRAGLDGWRLDVANSTGRRISDAFTHEVLRELRAAMTAEKPDTLLVGEHAHDWTTDADVGGWQAAMNYGGFTKPIWSWLATEPSEFLGVPSGIPRLSATAVLATITAFGARASWGTRTRSWSLLDSHDTPRFHTLVGGDLSLVEVGVGLSATLPGTPMMFAGDEFGMDGRYAEDARRPLPWQRPPAGAEQLHALYRTMFGLRSRFPALRTGSMCVLHADADSMTFLRETLDERLLVRAARVGVGAITLPLTGPAWGVHAAGDIASRTPLVLPRTDGAALQVWQLEAGS